MEHYDVLVVGSGSGMTIASNAVANGLRVAVVEKGPMGGTCLNRGCIPSKMLLYPADVIALIKEARKLGVDASVNSIDFKGIMDRMRRTVREDSERQGRAVEQDGRITWYKDVGEFTSDYTMKASSSVFSADKVFIASGARCLIPPIKGLDEVSYLTNETLLELDDVPDSMIVVGGGFVAVEYAHFFSQMGTNVTVVQRASRLLPGAEPEISNLLAQELSKYMTILTGHEAVEARESEDEKVITITERRTARTRTVSAKVLLLAAGRRSNSDLVKPEKTGVETDERGYIKVNEFLETTKPRIWAFGDAVGKHMFKHVANYEAEILWHNIFGHPDHKIKLDYSAIPYAVFGHPEVASVGMTESEARRAGRAIATGTAEYKATAKGLAMGEPEGLVKVIVDRESGKILGGHIIGPHASILIQAIINIMNCHETDYATVLRALHIHPALPEVVLNAFAGLH